MLYAHLTIPKEKPIFYSIPYEVSFTLSNSLSLFLPSFIYFVVVTFTIFTHPKAANHHNVYGAKR